MIAIIVPVHNEEATLGACLAALRLAATHPAVLAGGDTVQIIVVLDTCSDASHAIAVAAGVTVLQVALRNVGAVRSAGARHALDRGARWLANTDADTIVAADWLWQQLRLGVDIVCGTVTVTDWSDHGTAGPFLQAHFARTYTDADNHRHIHGANLGVAAHAYERVGGFAALVCSEDVALVQALLASGATIAWTAAPRVVTSARRQGRACGGFADTLCAVVDAASAACQTGLPACPPANLAPYPK